MQPNQYRDIRLEKLEKLKALGLDAWPRKAKRTHGIAQLAGTMRTPKPGPTRSWRGWASRYP